MRSSVVTILSFLILFSCKQVPQELIIPLSTEIGKGPISQRSFLPEPNLYDSLNIEGTPTDLKKLDYRRINFQFRHAGKIKQDIIFCVGERNDSIIVIIDANNNYTFTDDRKFLFKKELNEDEKNSIQEKLLQVNTCFKYLNGNDTINVKLALKINPYPRVSITQRVGEKVIDIFENEVKIALTVNDFRTAQFKLNGKKYKVALNSSQRPIFNEPGCNSLLIIEDWENDFVPTWEGYVPTKLKEDILFDNLVYVFDSVSKFGDTLKLIFKDKLKTPVGVNVGEYLPNFKKGTIDGKLFQLSNFRGNYILIDFWGTWCKPCLESIPELKSLNEEFSDKGLIMISVAYDKNIELVINGIKEHGLSWYNIFQDQQDNSAYALTKLFKVTAFPTLLFISPEGQIIERVHGYDTFEFEKIRKTLEQNL